MAGAQDKQMARLSALIPLLLSGPIKRQEAAQRLAQLLHARDQAEAFGAHEDQNPIASLDRDIKRLKDAAWLQFGPGRTYEASPGPDLPLWLTPEEAQALRLAMAVLEQMGLPESHTLSHLLKRVDPAVAGRQGQIPPTVAPSLAGVNPEHWAIILQGVEEGRRMVLGYRKPKSVEPEAVHLDRARLMWLGNAFYLVAYVPAKQAPGVADHQCVREYRLDRVVSVALQKGKVGRSRLPLMEGEALLSAHLAGRVSGLRDAEGDWLQQVHAEADGRLRFRFRAPSLLRAQQRLWNFGHQVEEVLGPPELVEAMGPYLKLAARLRRGEGDA